MPILVARPTLRDRLVASGRRALAASPGVQGDSVARRRAEIGLITVAGVGRTTFLLFANPRSAFLDGCVVAAHSRTTRGARP